MNEGTLKAGHANAFGSGNVFDLTGATSISVSGDPSLLDLSGWDGLVYGQSYTPVSGTFDADLASALQLSALSDPDMLGKAHIEVRDGEIVLVIDRLDGTSHIGAELATAISSQTEGNMAHIRRLRGAIGSGQTISTKNRIGAYITGYAENNRLDQDAQGRGYHRTEIGGTPGPETAFKNDCVVLGVALSAGRAHRHFTVRFSSPVPRRRHARRFVPRDKVQETAQYDIGGHRAARL